MRLGVDVGGTFTDLVLHDEASGRTVQAKTPSTPEDQSIGVANGVKLICEKAGVDPKDISLILRLHERVRGRPAGRCSRWWVWLPGVRTPCAALL